MVNRPSSRTGPPAPPPPPLSPPELLLELELLLLPEPPSPEPLVEPSPLELLLELELLELLLELLELELLELPLELLELELLLELLELLELELLPDAIYSTAPISRPPSRIRAKPPPRWSVDGSANGELVADWSAAPIIELPSRTACVGNGISALAPTWVPPLFSSALTSMGSAGVAVVPMMLLADSSFRLAPLLSPTSE